MSWKKYVIGMGTLLAVSAAGVATAPFASADRWPSSPGGRDPQTGFLCVSSDCATVRLPQSNCICTKENPTEMDFRKIRLNCYASEGLRWVACPQQPK